MKEIVSTITSKGQITIPIEVRRYLGVGVHDKVVFILDGAGTVTVQPARYPTVASLRGAAGSLEQPLSWDEMEQIAREDRLAGEVSPGSCVSPSSIPMF